MPRCAGEPWPREPGGTPPTQIVPLVGYVMPLAGEFEHVVEHGGLRPDEVERLHLVMPRDDLPACRFDRVLGIMQCH